MKDNARFVALVLLMFVGLLGFVTTVMGVELKQSDVTHIKKAVTDLVSNDVKLKQIAVETLNVYGTAAIPVFVEIMQTNPNVFIGYELVAYAEQYEEAGLSVVKQGLKDVNSNTRILAAKIACNMGPKAASIVNDIAKTAADNDELSKVRFQALDALQAIGTVNSEVKRALALIACDSNTMTAWRGSLAIKELEVSYDDLVPIMFAELASQDRTYPIYNILTGIARNLKHTSDPIALLKSELTVSNEAIERYLFQFFSKLYPTITDKTDELVQLLFDFAETGSKTAKEQTIYFLGEIAQEAWQATAGLLAVINDKNLSEEDYLMLVYALEKAAPDNKEVISLFIEILLDKQSSDELKSAATRYLEKSGAAAYPEMLVLFDQLESLDENILWQLSPLFYHAAKQETAVVDKLKELTDDNQPEFLQAYGNRLLCALGDETAASQEIVSADSPIDKVPAFPGAEGYGKYTIGGRGGKVYVVTNLNDRGPGSLRAAVEASGPRTVVFAVSGNIMLTEPLNVSNPYITIAGQTAPGEGITVAGAPVNINTDQVIIRYVRFRLGDYHNYEADAIGGRGISDIILDHISASWSTDETVSFYVTDNLTVQWSFITESLRGSVHVKGNHGYGGIWGGASSYHHNLMAHHSSRNPRFDGERTLADPAVDMRNNVIYNWGFNSAYGGEGGNHNIIANYYKPGPATSRGSVNCRIVEVSNGGKWYVADNYVYGYPKISADNWAGGVQPRVDRMEDIKQHIEFPAPYVITHTAEEAYELVLADAGCTLPMRDYIDQRIVEEVRTGTAAYGGVVTGLHSGIIDSQEDVGGLPFLRGFSAPLDSDQDGIPDWWAIKHGFDPEGGIDPLGDIDGDGYTNLEEYLNGTNPLVAELDISQLITQLSSPVYEISSNAENQLIAWADEAIPALEQVLNNQEKGNRVLRGIVTRLLGKIGSQKAVPALLNVIAVDNDSFVKVGALGSLKQIGICEPEVIDAVRTSLFDPSDDVKITAANVLGSFGKAADDVVIDLLLLSGSANRQFAWDCQKAAVKISPGVVPLKDYTIDKLIERMAILQWQDLAITILARNSSNSLGRIMDLIKDTEEKTALRVSALKVLQKVGISDAETLNSLITLVYDEQESFLVKTTAIKILQDVDLIEYPKVADKIQQAILENQLTNYINDHKIPILVENFSAENRQNVCVQALVGFPVEYKIRNDACLAVRDQNHRPLYSELKPLTYWERGEDYIRTAMITFYPDLQALEANVYMVDLNSSQVKLDKPKTINSYRQIKVSILEQGLELISQSKLDFSGGWIMQLIAAEDGTGDFTTVQGAIDAVPDNNNERIVIYIKEGLYHEKILIPKDKAKISLIGENKETTILDFNETPKIQHSSDELFNTWGSASTIVLSDDFTAENITFNNSALIGTGQALALRLEGDRMIFTNCNFISHQDTLFANGDGRQYFYNCYIEGDVDFIYGSATAVFEDCDIVNVRETGGYITAASTPEEREFGFVFINSRISGDVNPGSVWLGRPWRPYSHTAYINCYMSEVVQPTGWHNWGKISNEATARYLEYKSYGPGANPNGRVSWSRQLTDEEAELYTVENVLKGNDGWNLGINEAY